MTTLSSYTYLETGGPVEQLHHVTDGCLGGLRVLTLQSLHDEQHQYLARQRRAIFQSEQYQFQYFFLHS